MVDLPEVSEFKGSVRAFEPIGPTRYDVPNNVIQSLVNKPLYLSLYYFTQS